MELQNPKKALDFLDGCRPDLIFLDCSGEVERGLSLLKELKLHYPGIPVVFITEKRSFEVTRRAFRTGARDFIEKPLNVFELENSVDHLLRIRRTSQENRSPIMMPESSSDKEFGLSLTDEIPIYILRAIQYMAENLSDEIDLKKLAKEACLSKYHFCRLFSHHVGTPPMKFVTLLRVNKAKEFLKRGGMTESSLATELGFNDLGTFIRQFKKHTGVTPSGYRNSVNNKGFRRFTTEANLPE